MNLNIHWLVHFNVISLFLWICWNAIFARTCNIFSAHLAYIILSKWRNDEKPTTNKRRADDDRTEKKLDCSCALQTKVQRQIIRQRFMFTPEHKEICWLISKWKKKAIDKNADFSNWNPKLRNEQLKGEYKENQILTHNIDVPQRNFNGCFVDVP